MIDIVNPGTIGAQMDGGAPREDVSDETLLLHYRNSGERKVFDQLVHRYECEIYSYLCRYLGDSQMAEDVFQGTFLQVHRKCSQFQQGRQFRPWLYAIATHQAIDLQRKNKRHRMVSLDEDHHGDEESIATLMELLESRETPPLAGLEAEERRQWVRKRVDALPEMLRSVLVLVYYQGLKYREAAEVLGIPVGTVKSRLHSAILKLNQAWQSSRI